MNVAFQNFLSRAFVLEWVFFFTFSLASCTGGPGGGSGIGSLSDLPGGPTGPSETPPNPSPGGGGQAAPSSPEVAVAPEADPTKAVLAMSCANATCIPFPSFPGLGNQDSDKCQKVKYKFTGHMKLTLLPSANLPEWNGRILRMVDAETNQYRDFETKKINGQNGSFVVEVVTDPTPQISFYLAPVDYEPTVLDTLLPCEDSCIPPDWQVMEPLWTDPSCAFLNTNEVNLRPPGKVL